MQFTTAKKMRLHLWVFPSVFGLLGAIMGLFLRYVYKSGISYGFELKHILHSHSHVMLLGFILNAFIVLIWIHFTKSTDKKTYFLYLLLQGIVAILLVGFLYQGYAAFTIIFSTLHLWISYILLIRLWNKLEGQKTIILLVKSGIVMHFIASIGPYALGPLKILGYENSPWYQQCIFFYLHFQYFGSFFLWMMAIFIKNTKINLNKKKVLILVFSVTLLFTHSLDYSFDHIIINIIGIIGSAGLCYVFFSIYKKMQNTKKTYLHFYYLLLLMIALNFLGSTPYFSDIVAHDHFLLIAWLHFLFLGMYLPFIWLHNPTPPKNGIWHAYLVSFIFTEITLALPLKISELLNTPIMNLLFLGYFGVVICICIVHLNFLLKSQKNELTRT